jgi:GAF domain-containing protein
MGTAKEQLYREVEARIAALCANETDSIALMATVSCELHHAMPHFHWTGFYRVVEPQLLKIGPYQGGHGCLSIPFSRGVCGAAARTRQVVRVDDVHQFPDHIACSASTRSEIVVPVSVSGELVAVLDVDSNLSAAFDAVDERALQRICDDLGKRWETELNRGVIKSSSL